MIVGQYEFVARNITSGTIFYAINFDFFPFVHPFGFHRPIMTIDVWKVAFNNLNVTVHNPFYPFLVFVNGIIHISKK